MNIQVARALTDNEEDAQKLVTQDHVWRSAADNLAATLELYLLEYYGRRCPEYERGCGCCEAWKAYDRFKKKVMP